MQYIQQLLSRINLLYLCPFVQKILHLSLILCLVALTPMSAYAAGDSLTSSISLSFNSTKKFQLEAYEHFYAYYTMPSSYSRTKNTLSVTVSNLSNFSISVMNSDGSSISTTRKKNILYFKNNAFTAENRYFIKIHNQRNIRSSGSINIRYTTDTTASPKTSHKDATNIASSHKQHQQKSTKSSSSRNASRQKTTKSSSSRNASRQKTANNSSSRNASRQKTTNNSSSRNASRQKATKSSSSRNASRQKATKSSSSRKGKTAATNNASTCYSSHTLYSAQERNFYRISRKNIHNRPKSSHFVYTLFLVSSYHRRYRVCNLCRIVLYYYSRWILFFFMYGKG